MIRLGLYLSALLEHATSDKTVDKAAIKMKPSESPLASHKARVPGGAEDLEVAERFLEPLPETFLKQFK